MKNKVFFKGILTALMCTMLVQKPVDLYAAENEQTKHSFLDVEENQYYYDAILWASENGITNGVSEDYFGVSDSCTRGQGITFLWRAEGSQEPSTTENAFDDVNNGDYYYHAVLWGGENDIVKGQNKTSFAPGDTLTRGQFITFLYRLLGEDSTIKNPFSDVSENAYYHDAVLWAVENGITTGTTETTFEPETICMRSQVVTFLWRAYSLQSEPEEDLDDKLDEDVENKEEIEQQPDQDNPEVDNEENAEDIEIGEIIIEDISLPVNAVEYGLSTENSGIRNSKILQALVDTVSVTGGTIYIPEGEYTFSEIGTQTIGSHCIKMKSNVNIIGDGTATVLKPTGQSNGGLDMFYYNDYVDYGIAKYLENCNFSDFVIDGENTSCRWYTSAGKGFMFNLFKNCNWTNVIVRNTDATGFGVDCPIGGSMVNCIAVNCGKAAEQTSAGGAGFGIGFGYSEDEYFTISNCKAYNNKTFGFFFEHQGRYNSRRYQALYAKEFMVNNCNAIGNYYNYGGLLAMNTTYTKCMSSNAWKDGYFFENSKTCNVTNSVSYNDTNASFSILQSNVDGGTQEVSDMIFEQCTSIYAAYGAQVINQDSQALMTNNAIRNCNFLLGQEYAVATSGTMQGLTLEGNVSDLNECLFEAVVENFVNENNSWNVEEDDKKNEEDTPDLEEPDQEENTKPEEGTDIPETEESGSEDAEVPETEESGNEDAEAPETEESGNEDTEVPEIPENPETVDSENIESEVQEEIKE